MKFYKTIINNGEVRFEFIDKAYIRSANSYSAIIFKDYIGWNATELITGALMASGKTKKSVMADLDKIERDMTPETIQSFVNKRIELVRSFGGVLPNLAERNA